MSTLDIQVMLVTPPFDGLAHFDYGLRSALDPVFDWQEFGVTLLNAVPENTLLLAEGTFLLHYAMFRMPDAEDTLVLLGPWRTERVDPRQDQWIRQQFTGAAYASIQEYFGGIRPMQDDVLISWLSAMVSMVFPAGEFRQVYKQEFLPFRFRLENRFLQEPTFAQDIPVNMLEERYAAEEELMDAVSHGDQARAFTAMVQQKRFDFGGRFEGSLRAVKNKLIILNTLLRKAIQRSQIHPYYIDQISCRYALEIDKMDIAQDNALTTDMVREYCAYVKKYSLREYSPLIQKVINHINLNLSSTLSLKSLSSMCFITPSYLSNLFKQETGTTLTDYINTQRIHRAARLLCASSRGVADVAEEVGILDVNYFTKIFKKTMGATPTVYRRVHKNH